MPAAPVAATPLPRATETPFAATVGVPTPASPIPSGSPVPGNEPASRPKVRLSGQILLAGGSNPSLATITVSRISKEVRAEMVVEGLEVPWALAFPSGDRMLITERPGRIRVVQGGHLLPEPLATLEVVGVSEAGLMGIAVDPEFVSNGFIYICYTRRAESGQVFNRIARLTDTGEKAEELVVVLDGIPAARNHNGCRLRFGPDGMLYATMGDAQVPESAQELESLSGKILRLEKDGSIPADNPFPSSYVYSYGHRNPQGLDWHPSSGQLYVTEHGPREDDEVNLIRAGGNYGWPEVTGQDRLGRFEDPILSFTPTIAVAGAAFYSGDSLPSQWENSFIFANLKGSHLRRIRLAEAEGFGVITQEVLFAEEFGRLRAVAMGPDGYIYFSTSNRDGRGRPFPGDDKVMRLVPAVVEVQELGHPDGEGNFGFGLEPGEYRLEVKAPGFQSIRRNLTLEEDANSVNLAPIQLDKDP